MADFISVTRALAALLIPELEYLLHDLSHASFHRYAPFVDRMFLPGHYTPFLHLFHTNHEQPADNIGVGWKLAS